MKRNDSVFETLFQVNVNDYVEKKRDLSYLSWTYAWAEVKKNYPGAHYKVHLFGEKQLPYVFDENTGYMVFTSVTIEDLTHTMWLPVMDSANKAMKSKAYTYDTKFKKGLTVDPASMFDINKTIMRCLVKNLAMFGLGLYIYSGEDLPEIETEKITQKEAATLKEKIRTFEDSGKIYTGILKKHNIRSLKELTIKQYEKILDALDSEDRKETG